MRVPVFGSVAARAFALRVACSGVSVASVCGLSFLFVDLLIDRLILKADRGFELKLYDRLATSPFTNQEFSMH